MNLLLCMEIGFLPRNPFSSVLNVHARTLVQLLLEEANTVYSRFALEKYNEPQLFC